MVPLVSERVERIESYHLPLWRSFGQYTRAEVELAIVEAVNFALAEEFTTVAELPAVVARVERALLPMFTGSPS